MNNYELRLQEIDRNHNIAMYKIEQDHINTCYKIIIAILIATILSWVMGILVASYFASIVFCFSAIGYIVLGLYISVDIRKCKQKQIELMFKEL